MDMQSLYLLVPLAPLVGALAAGLFGKRLGRAWSHRITVALVAVSFFASAAIFQDVQSGHMFNGSVYTWLTSGEATFQVGFLIDSLTALMMLVVTFVSLMVHIYTIGYMKEDPGYQRFFSYISLFTFSMLMLVMANNFMQLFFGWEAVGLVSYLLIGFWYDRPTAIYANLKAFLVNRVGDFGFLLGIALVLMVFGTLDYAAVFANAARHVNDIAPIPGMSVNLLTAICILLFIGAMGKSAQFPLHVWLPDSMEGPTPISALIHAATMVTAGIFMVARMSPMFELSETALSFVMVIGAITALFMGFLGMIQNDIKRVIAYSTLSQLGYMTVALGAQCSDGAQRLAGRFAAIHVVACTRVDVPIRTPRPVAVETAHSGNHPTLLDRGCDVQEAVRRVADHRHLVARAAREILRHVRRQEEAGRVGSRSGSQSDMAVRCGQQPHNPRSEDVARRGRRSDIHLLRDSRPNDRKSPEFVQLCEIAEHSLTPGRHGTTGPTRPPRK